MKIEHRSNSGIEEFRHFRHFRQFRHLSNFSHLFQQTGSGNIAKRGHPNLNQGIPSIIRNVDNTPSVFFLKKQKGSRRIESADRLPVVFDHVVLKKIDYGIALNFGLKRQYSDG